MKKVMLIHIASLIVSFLCIAFGIYMLINNEYFFAGAFLFGGYAMGWDDWKTFLTKKKS
tara:strand:- start:2588 stop:2764 length:177 start_codon:yes stop_codon:yes gene_type:complete